MDHEKALPPDEKTAVPHPTVETANDGAGEDWREQEDFMTRNGLNFRSFQRRPVGASGVVLDKSMKTRHLHMIAIGGSIGAGFFVGSGGALAKGVSGSRLDSLRRPPHTMYRALLLSSLTLASWAS